VDVFKRKILFVIKPECLVSMLFCSVMFDHEAILITGCERFSTYSGYANTFTFLDNYVDPTPMDLEMNCIKNHVVAIDAIESPFGQFSHEKKLRDTNKCYTSLFGSESEESGDDKKVFVTGNWGCGAFGGDLQLKAIQQIIAASEANFDIIYTTFGKGQFQIQLQEFVDYLKDNNITVGQLYRALDQINESTKRSFFEIIDIFDKDRQELQEVPTGNEVPTESEVNNNQ